MVYAYPSNRPFVTSKPLKKKVITEEMKTRRKFIEEHYVSIYRDKKTGEMVAEVIKKQ